MKIWQRAGFLQCLFHMVSQTSRSNTGTTCEGFIQTWQINPHILSYIITGEES